MASPPHGAPPSTSRPWSSETPATNSGSGVAFTRDPANGENVLYGEFLVNAQGEDVVAGVRTPTRSPGMEKALPAAFKELLKVRKKLEKHFKDVQDVEFTIQDGKLFMLQTRNGKRTAAAALKIAVDMVKEKLIDWKTALSASPPTSSTTSSLRSSTSPKRRKPKRSPKAFLPVPVPPPVRSISTPTAPKPPPKGEKVLLVRVETSPEDLRGMIAAEGILTARGGVSSHAALVARQMGKVCVCGASGIEVDYDKKTVKAGGKYLQGR